MNTNHQINVISVKLTGVRNSNGYCLQKRMNHSWPQRQTVVVCSSSVYIYRRDWSRAHRLNLIKQERWSNPLWCVQRRGDTLVPASSPLLPLLSPTCGRLTRLCGGGSQQFGNYRWIKRRGHILVPNICEPLKHRHHLEPTERPVNQGSVQYASSH